MSETTCKTCPWFYVESDDARMMNLHECHKNAPMEGHWSCGHYLARWPETMPDDWCGEHPGRQARTLELQDVVAVEDAELLAHRLKEGSEG